MVGKQPSEQELLLCREVARQVVANPLPPKSDFLSKIELNSPKNRDLWQRRKHEAVFFASKGFDSNVGLDPS